MSLQRTDPELFTKAKASQFFPSGTDRETFQSLARMLHESTTQEVTDKFVEADGMLDNQSKLREIATPVLVIHRRGDQVVPFAWGQYMARRLPNVSFLPLDGDAHFPWVDDAESVLRPTIEFLSDD